MNSLSLTLLCVRACVCVCVCVRVRVCVCVCIHARSSLSFPRVTLFLYRLSIHILTFCELRVHLLFCVQEAEEDRRRRREQELEAELAEEEKKLQQGDGHNIEAERDSLNRLARGNGLGRGGGSFTKATENYESEPGEPDSPMVSTGDRMRTSSQRAASDTDNDSERH